MGQASSNPRVKAVDQAVEQTTRSIPVLSAELKHVTLSGDLVYGDELGRGSYGIVYKVTYRQENYAAKEIHKLLIQGVNAEDRQAIKDGFIKECLCCSVNHHPNIVEFIGVHYSDRSDLPIMVMELMNASLTTFVKSHHSNIDLHTKMSVVYDVSCGLTYLHNRKQPIIHRDLSSNNVMLTHQPVRAKIGDLGVAKVIRPDRLQTMSKLTQNPGTTDFMPPETLVADPIYGLPVDVFSFAGIVLHVFSEEWPHPSATKVRDEKTGKYIAPTEAERRQKYLNKMAGDNIVIMLRNVVQRCLDDDPEERPSIQDVKAIIELLRVRL